MANNDKRFTSNYDGSPIPEGEVMVAFPYTELDAENCVNPECLGTVRMRGKTFRVIYKAVPAQWAKEARSAMWLVENEELGHYHIANSVSVESLYDEFALEVGSAPSAEDILFDEDGDMNKALATFADLMKKLIEKSPKIGYAVLLLHTGIKGSEFYKRMRLTHQPANRIRQQAESILKEGLMSFDTDSLNRYKSAHDEAYREEAMELLDRIVEKIQQKLQ